jgi:hypothetical protein
MAWLKALQIAAGTCDDVVTLGSLLCTLQRRFAQDLRGGGDSAERASNGKRRTESERTMRIYVLGGRGG